MLTYSSKYRYFLCRGATDMRNGFDGLGGLVRKHFEADLMSGDVFIFINRKRDRVKMLAWDVTGFAIYYKRLERGTFEIPLDITGKRSVELNYATLVMLLEGIELEGLKKRKRYGMSG